MAERKIKTETAPDREIVITRTVDAPRERVWDAWTDPKQVAQWWGPTGFTTTIHKMDVRPGGVWEHTMRGPDGTEYPNHSLFREVVRPERIVYTLGGKVGGKEVSFESTWTFEAVKDKDGEKTKVTIRMVFPSAQERDRVVKESGAIEGGNQTLGRLAGFVSGAAKKPDLFLTRTLDAPRDLVFKVWTDPAHLKGWWGPGGFTNPRLEADARAGGRIVADMRAPDGAIYPMSGTFTEVIPPQKISFLSGALDEHGKSRFEVLTTVTFAERHGKTVLTLEAWVTMQTPAAAPHLAGMETGWNQSLDRMVDHTVCHAPDAFVISRELDAPRDLVFRVWTEKEHLMKWFGPKGMGGMKVGTFDFRPGGIFHYAMSTPDGKEMWGKWIFRDIVPPERIVIINAFSDEKGGLGRHPFAPNWPPEMLSSTSFEETNGKTAVTIRWAPHTSATEAERKVFNDSHASMQQGWGGTFEVLAEYLASVQNR